MDVWLQCWADLKIMQSHIVSNKLDFSWTLAILIKYNALEEKYSRVSYKVHIIGTVGTILTVMMIYGSGNHALLAFFL